MFSIGLAEIVFIVKDVKVAARFYRDVVGLVPQTRMQMNSGHGSGQASQKR